MTTEKQQEWNNWLHYSLTNQFVFVIEKFNSNYLNR